ncbi:MAG: hypothetical protein D6819_08605 [Gammaproteobacteria bacterium]|nr:MAG: hypothetical protein D6819_08605 [Gammaproteobacteria bacterium]
MKKPLAFLVLAAAIPAVQADSPFSANVALATDYPFRGISQTDEEPAIQGGFDFNHESGLYLGTWASNVDFNDGDEAQMELDLYGGFAKEFSGIGVDVGLIYYAYPGAASDLDYDFLEIYGGLSYSIASIKYSYSNDYFAGSGTSGYLEGGVDIPLPQDFSLGLHIGRQWIDEEDTFGTPDYTDWKIAVSKEIAGFGFELSYVDTDLSDKECFGGTDLCDARGMFILSKSM